MFHSVEGKSYWTIEMIRRKKPEESSAHYAQVPPALNLASPKALEIADSYRICYEDCSLKRGEKEKREQSHIRCSSATFLHMHHLYRVTVQVTASVSPFCMLVDEKLFSKTSAPPDAALKRPDRQMPLTVPVAANTVPPLFATV